MTLKALLTKQDKTRWLDVGCGGVFDDNFYYVDLFPEGVIDPKFRNRYFRIDILNSPEHELDKLGKFNLLRMQHTFEHFSYEEGRVVLKNCAKLLNKDGYILISTPDLKIHINKYLNNKYKNWKGFKWWALKRIPENAPDSFYFSIFTHSMPFEQHKWCYDYEGLEFILREVGEFENIKELKATDELADIPFTHNRPEEDVCVIAQKK
ncbi:MAG: methyltransferase domain-containing protein [bacterium]|nr:methyltransferase domain-containing protein [bacterium]